MAVKIGAGKYVAGKNIQEGDYDLKALSGDGMLIIQTGKEKSDFTQLCFGKEDGCAKIYRGLSLEKGLWFEITDDVTAEISKAKMLEID